MNPSLSGYVEFIRAHMRISTADLPDASPWIPATYDTALRLVNPALLGASYPYLYLYPYYGQPDPSVYPSLYAMAIYNLGGDLLINWATDLPDAQPVAGSNPALPYFAYAREKYNTLGFTSGVVQSTNNDASGVSLAVPEQLQSLTVMDLQNLKTPWGRAYIGIAQQYGPTVWGIS